MSDTINNENLSNNTNINNNKSSDIKKTLILDLEKVKAFFLDKNPFNIDIHEKNVLKFKNITQKLNYKVIFINNYIDNSPDNLQRIKNSYTTTSFPERKGNSFKLVERELYLLSIILRKNDFNVFLVKNDLKNAIYQFALNDDSDEIKVVANLYCSNVNLVNKKNIPVEFFNKIFYDSKDMLDFQCDYIIVDNVVYNESAIQTTEYIKYIRASEFNLNRITKLENFNKNIQTVKLDENYVNNKQNFHSTVFDLTLNNINDNQIMLCCKAFAFHELPNSYEILKPLRQAVYKKLNIPFIVEEVLHFDKLIQNHPVNKFICSYVTPSDEKTSWLNWNPDKIYKTLFLNLEKPSTLLFTEYNAHVASIFFEICFYLTISKNPKEKNDEIIFYNYIKDFREKVRPKEKVVTKKKCRMCSKPFELKESETEYFILKNIPYTEICKDCSNYSKKLYDINKEIEKNKEDILKSKTIDKNATNKSNTNQKS